MLAKYFISSALSKSQLAPYCFSAIAGSEQAHAKPKALYKQTNKQETDYCYMKSMLRRQEVLLLLN